MSNQKFEVAIIGLGAIGSATLMHLAKAGVRALGIDRYSPPHEIGSSHGETRITRQAIGEGAAYIPLVQRSHELWRSIADEVGLEILTCCGGLVTDGGLGGVNHGVEEFTKKTIEMAKQFNIPHQVLSGKDAKARFPEFNFEDSALIYYEPGAGFVRPERAIEAQLKIAEKRGASIRTNERVSELQTTSHGTVQIKTESGIVEAEKCLVSSGAWIKEFVPNQIKPFFKVYRQVLHWLPIVKNSYSLKTSPIFIWCYGPSGEDQIYGFPSLDDKSIKVASESYIESESIESVDRVVSEAEQSNFLQEKVATRLHSIAGPALKSAVCAYTVTPQSKFIIDFHPEMSQVLIASCCSGHGFKHSAALGEAIASTFQGKKPSIDISCFKAPS